MPYKGGYYQRVGEQQGVGTFLQIASKDRGAALASTRGVLAVPLELDWGADDGIQVFRVEDFNRNCKETFGYESTDPELRNVREMFLGGAQELIVARLNGKGGVASNYLCKAKYPGIRGNALEVVIQADPDAGVIDNPLNSIKASFKASGDTVTATYTKLPNNYTTLGEVYKEGVKITNVIISQAENQVSYKFPGDIDEGTYDVKAYVKDGEVISLISTASIGITIDPETHRTVKLTKGEETPGETVETATVAFEVSSDTVKATISNKPEGYDVRYTIKNGSDVVIAETPGRLWIDNEGDVYTLHFTPDVGSGTYKLEIALIKQQKGAKKQVIGTVSATCAIEGVDKPALAVTKYNSATAESYDPEIPAKFTVQTFLEGQEVDKQKVRNIKNLKNNDFVIFDKSVPLEDTAGMPLSGGSNSEVSVANYSEALDRLEPQVFHILACPIKDESIQSMFVEYTRRLRDEQGIRFQTVMPTMETPPDYEGVICVSNVASYEGENSESDLVYFTAGLQAGCEIQNSCGNRTYTGVYDVDTDFTVKQMDIMQDEGCFFYHLARGTDARQHVKSYLDINSLTTFKEGQNEDWTRNQTIRVLDQICNDVAAMFNNNYALLVGNTDTGRALLGTDIRSYLANLQVLGAIQDYDPSSVVISAVDKRVVLAEIAITPVNAMEQLYLNILVQ